MHLLAIVVQTETGESKSIWLEDIFNDHNYYFRKSITLQLGIEWYSYIKNTGWSMLQTENAHFINKQVKQDYNKKI